MGQEQLLRRCVLGATQNSNESLNSLVWVRCPKHKYHGPKSVQIAVTLAILSFNKSHRSKIDLMKKLSIPSHKTGQDIWEKRDRKRVAKADKAKLDKEKKRRQCERKRKLQREEALREKEGVQYEAGGF